MAFDKRRLIVQVSTQWPRTMYTFHEHLFTRALVAVRHSATASCAEYVTGKRGTDEEASFIVDD
jgi:hypothetical protein